MAYEHLIDLNDLSVSKWNEIISLALKIKKNESEIYTINNN